MSPILTTWSMLIVLFSLTHFLLSLQVCDSDTMLDPASSVEMVKVLEEDPMVGGVGGDVQVCMALVAPLVIDSLNTYLLYTKLCARCCFWRLRHIRMCLVPTVLPLLLSKLK